MHLRKKLTLFVIFTTFLIFFGCESTTNYKTNTSTHNKLINSDSKKKVNNNLNLEVPTDNKDNIQKNTLNVGLMLPLSGKHYQIGQSLLNSAQLAASKTGNRKIIFNIIDTGDDTKVLTKLDELLEQNIDIFIGPVFTNKINKVKQITKSNNIPMLALSNNSELEDEELYVFGLTLEDEINQLLEYSKRNNLRKYAVIIPKNEYGYRVESEINKFKSKNNSMSFKFIFYDTKSTDFYEVSKDISNYEERKLNLANVIQTLESENTEDAKDKIKQLKKMDTYGELNFEALIIFAQNFQEVSNFSSILPYYDVDPKKIQYMGNSIWAKNLALKEPGLVNGYFTSLDLNSRKKFEDIYISIYNSKPHPLASLSYDLVGLITKLHTKERGFTINMLHTTSGFIGVEGWFKILPDGKVLRKPKIYKIKNQNFTLLN